ncbi:MAG TPA: response regulator, partial [Gemmataceae bacterium]|nr:response regulator [Gemmataceae bacterium]
ARARAHLREAVALDPTSEMGWLWLAGVTDDPVEAIAYLERVLRLNPGSHRARAGIEHFKAKLPAPQWYCPICENTAAAKFVNCPNCGAVLDLGRADQALNNAAADLAKVRTGADRLATDLRVQPTYVAHYYLGMALLNLGRAADALAQFRAAQKFKPDDFQLAAQVVQLEALVPPPAPPPRKGPPGQTVRKTPPPATGPVRSVLVVDDSPTIRRVLGLTLQKNGFQVVEAADGEEALDRAREKAPDVVLLDVQMPGMDGYAVCQQLRQSPATARTPVVLLGGRDGARPRAGGPDWHMPKPFRPAAVVRVVRDCCPAAG